MPRYEGRDKTARFIQFAARFIVGLLARVCCLQVMCAALSFQMPRISKTLIVARVVQPYSRFSRKLDHELVDCTKKHQFPLHTSINNNKPFASTAGSWFPTFSLKQISSIEVSLICSICHIYSHYSSHVFPCFPHAFPMFSSRGWAQNQGTGRCGAPLPRGNAEALGRHDCSTEEHFVWAATGSEKNGEIHPLWWERTTIFWGMVKI